MLEYKGYIGQVEYDDSVGMLHGRVINIRDTITFEAKDVESLVCEFHFSIDDYLAWCEEQGEAPEKPFSGKLNVRLGSDLHRELATRAAKEGVSLNTFIKRKLEESVG